MKRRKEILLFIIIIFAISFVSSYQLNLTEFTSTSLTLERDYIHVSVSDPDLILYLPFDIQEPQNNKTYDFSNNSNDGFLQGGVNWKVDGFIGGLMNLMEQTIIFQ